MTMTTKPRSLAAPLAQAAILLLSVPADAWAYTGQDPVFTRAFFDHCAVYSVRARLGADGASVKYSVDGSCPGGRISGQLGFRGGVFNEVFDLGAAGVLRSKGTCSDNPWIRAARCEDVSVQGDGPRIAALLAERPSSSAGELSAPFSNKVPGADAAFRKAHETAERPNPPMAPVGVQVSQPLGSASVRVSWFAPDESGDRPYLYFLVHARPRARDGAAWTEVGKIGRGSQPAYASSIRLPPPVAGTNGWDVRLCSATALAVTCGAFLTPDSVKGNAVAVVAAPNMSSVSSGNTPVASVGRVTSSPPVVATLSTCERAADAQARKSPAASALTAKCRAEGGQPEMRPSRDLNALAAEGEALVAGDALATMLRESVAEGEPRRGFDIAMAVAWSQTEWGPGKQQLLDSLSAAAQSGFRTAISYLFDRNRYADRARIGASIVAADATLAIEGSGEEDARYRLGFEIATAIFGDPALGAQGNTAPGPGSLGIRNSLSAPAQRGFDAAMKLHLLRTY